MFLRRLDSPRREPERPFSLVRAVRWFGLELALRPPGFETQTILSNRFVAE
jgi:hypothetical protein